VLQDLRGQPRLQQLLGLGLTSRQIDPGIGLPLGTDRLEFLPFHFLHGHLLGLNGFTEAF
jgi:hypothetical protein